MDKYLVVKKPSALRVSSEKQSSAKKRYQPYSREQASSSSTYSRLHQPTEFNPATLNPDEKLSTDGLNKLILSTLSDKSNPITHSDIYERTEHIVSAATGHQRGDGRRANGHHTAYFEGRSNKLSEQKAASAADANEPQILRNVRVYINGYLSNTTDIEMKRIIVRAGGDVLLTPSGATHILTSQQLSGSKTHKFLTTKSRRQVHVIRPEWVFDSIKAGKKLKEFDYAVVKLTNTKTLTDIFSAK